MKKLLFTLLMLLTINISAQDTIVSTLEKESMSFQEAVKPYIERLVNGLETGVDFAVRETPIVIQQYLVYEAIFYWTWILVSISMVIGSWSLGGSIIKSAKKTAENTVISTELPEWEQGNLRERRDRELETSKGGALALVIVVSTIASAIFFFNIFSAIKVTFFPKLYLVQEFINLF